MIIEFGEINYKIFVLLLYPTFIHLRKLVPNIMNDNYYFDLFRFYLSYILSIIFLIIIKKRTRKSIKNNESINNNKGKLNEEKEDWINPLIIEKKNTMKNKNIQNIAFIILLIFVGLITNLFYVISRIVYYDDNCYVPLLISKQSIGPLFEITYFLILGKLILNNRLYKHHFFSLVIMLFGLIFLIFDFTLYFGNDTFAVILYYMLYNFLFCLSYTLGKKYLTIFYIPPYNLMVYIGIITSIILLIYDTIAYFIVKEKNIKIHGIILGFKNNFNLKFIFIFIFDISLYFLTNIGIWLTVYYFTPFHFIISESISEYLFYSFYYMRNEAKDYFIKRNIILYIIIYIINLFFSLIFNEVIILKFWRLNYNTEKYIKEREKEDCILISKNTNQLDYSTNTSLMESYVNN